MERLNLKRHMLSGVYMYGKCSPPIHAFIPSHKNNPAISGVNISDVESFPSTLLTFVGRLKSSDMQLLV